MAVDRDPYEQTPRPPMTPGMADRSDMLETTEPRSSGNTWAWAIGALVVLLALFALFGLGGRDVNTTATTTDRPAATAPATGPASRPATAPATPAKPATPPAAPSAPANPQ